MALTAENVNNLGGRISGNAVAITARTDLNNIGGQIDAANQATTTGVTGKITVNVGGLKWNVVVRPGPGGVLNVNTAYPTGAAPWP